MYYLIEGTQDNLLEGMATSQCFPSVCVRIVQMCCGGRSRLIF